MSQKTTSMKRDSFIFYRSFYEALNDLPEKEQLEVYKAIADYSLNFKEPKLKGISSTILKLIIPQLKANNTRWENGTKGAEHGAKGGRPTNPKETPPEPLDNPTLTPNKNTNKNNNSNKEDINTPDESADKYQKFIGWFNSELKTNYRGDKKSRAAFNARIKEGYTGENFGKALAAMKADEHHKENGYKWITPEFITRVDKLEKFINTDIKPVNEPINWNIYLQ